MNIKATKENWKHELQKLIRRLSEQKSISQVVEHEPQSEEIQRIRARNLYLRDEMIRRSYL